MGKTDLDLRALKKCKALIEAQLDWGPAHEWEARDFTNLSNLIFDRTRARLSETTLKRIWGRVKYRNFPSASTLEVLVNFLGVASWREFKLQEQLNGEPVVFDGTSIFSSKRRGIQLLGLLLLLALGALPFMFFSNDSEGHHNEIVFQSEVLAGKFPKAVKFEIDSLEKRQSDRTIRLYGDDNRIDVRIRPDEHATIGMYYYPGVYRAKLLKENTVVKEKDVVLKSEDWLTTLTKGFSVDYFQNATDPGFSGLRLRPSFVDSLGGNINDKELIYHLTPPFVNFKGDNFSLATTVGFEDRQETATLCKRGRIVLLGNKNKLIVPFMGNHCSKPFEIKFGDNEAFTSEKYDLALLRFDFNKEHDLNLKISDRTLTLEVDGNKTVSIPYTNDLGQIMGIRFGFEGDPLGMVTALQLVNHNNTEMVYSFSNR